MQIRNHFYFKISEENLLLHNTNRKDMNKKLCKSGGFLIKSRENNRKKYLMVFKYNGIGCIISLSRKGFS